MKKAALVFLWSCVIWFALAWLVEEVFVLFFVASLLLGLILLGAHGARTRKQKGTRKPSTSSGHHPSAAGISSIPAPASVVKQPSTPFAAQSPSRLASGHVLNNRYEVDRQLRTGGMAVITLARDKQTNSRCVIKMPRYDTAHDYSINIDKLTIEAGCLRQFNHPHVVRFVDLFTHDNMLHLVVEYIEGEDLLVAFSRGPAEERRVIKWGGQILDALEYIHRSGVVHRDINPGNIMLRPDGSVTIIDFGTVKPARVDGATAWSKPGFNIPEQAQRGYADEKSDICGVGGTLFYLLTCSPPGFIGTRDAAGVLVGNGVSQRTAHCIAQALQLDPKLRFGSASAMRRALTGV